jgi:glucokinase
VIAAFDIGGTHVTAALVDPGTAAVLPETRRRTALPADGSREELGSLVVGAAQAVASPEVKRGGVAVPAPFDYEQGISRLRHKLPGLYGVDVRRELAGALGVPGRAVTFVNDAAAFLLGESGAGAARGHMRAVGITLGTGLGSAFLVDGRIVDSGPDVPTDGALYLVPFRGADVEDRISRRGLLARYPEPAVDVEQVAGRARRGDGHAAAAFHDVAAELAEFLRPWVDGFGAQCLVVGGSIAQAWDLIMPGLAAGLESVQPLELVVRAAQIDDAPLLGAALHAARGGEP